jgi:membrane-associated phospholipid phosphatase
MLHLLGSACACLILLVLQKKHFFKRAWGYLMTVLCFMFIIGILKIAVGRARPLYFLETDFYGFSYFNGFKSAFRSFPSSHTAAALAFCRYFELFQHTKKKHVILSLVILLISSRIFLCEHYLSDILVGAFIGWYSADLSFFLEKKIGQITKIARTKLKLK